MFYFFPDNYLWSQATARALSTGGVIGEAAPTLAKLADLSAEGSVDDWFDAWSALGDRVWEYGERELSAGYTRSGGQTMRRACIYYQWATNFMAHTDPRRVDTHRRSIAAFQRFADSHDPRIERVELPYEDGAHIPGWFIPGRSQATAKPTLLFLSGVDATKEQGYPFAEDITSRGFNVLAVDGPGVVESVLFQGLKNRPDEEVPGKVCIDYLVGRDDVDVERLAVVGISMGSYRASRLTAFDDRVRAMVAWGGQWDRHETVKARFATKWKVTTAPLQHFLYTMDATDDDDLLEKLKAWRLEPFAHQITCPVLITHGSQDKSTPLAHAYAMYEGIGSEQKELKVFNDDTGGVEHCQNDNRLLAHAYVGDWLEDTLVHGKDRRGITVGWESNRENQEAAS